MLFLKKLFEFLVFKKSLGSYFGKKSYSQSTLGFKKAPNVTNCQE